MRILTPHLALTYPNHCPTFCRTDNHFANTTRKWISNISAVKTLAIIKCPKSRAAMSLLGLLLVVVLSTTVHGKFFHRSEQNVSHLNCYTF